MKTVLLAGLVALLVAVPTAVALVDESIELPPEAQDLIGCEHLRIIVTEEGETDVYFYNLVPDPNNPGEFVEERCDPLS